MHGYVGAMGGPYGGHERTLGCMGAREWPYGGHGWVVGCMWFGFHGEWTVEEVGREVGLVGMEFLHVILNLFNLFS